MDNPENWGERKGEEVAGQCFQAWPENTDAIEAIESLIAHLEGTRDGLRDDIRNDMIEREEA